MALSGSLTKKYFYSKTHCHWIEWTATQNIATNQSTVTISFKSTWTSGYGTYSESRNINQIRFNGTNYSRSTSITGSVGTVTQFSTTQVITHNADGTATFKLGGRHRLNSGYSDYVYWNDVTFTLDTIPRISPIGTISGSTIGSKVTVNISAASSSFNHKWSARFPNVSTVKDSGSVAAGVSSFSFTPAMNWCSNIPNATSGTCYIYVDTYSGSTKIGSTTKSFTINVPSSVKPSISSISRTETVSTVSNVTSKFVQTLSRLAYNVSASGSYGSTISSYTVTTNGQTFSTKTGTTSALKSSGTNTISCTVKDSRGRSGTYSTTYAVAAYSPPSISSFNPTRSSNTTVTITSNAKWSQIAGNATFVLRERVIGGSYSTISTLNSTTSPYIKTYTRTGKSDIQSYEYSYTITDNFGKTATTTSVVGTSFQELTIRPGVGIGIGKVHEKGALDVQGEVYFDDVKVDLPAIMQSYSYGDPPSTNANNVTNNGIYRAYLEEGGLNKNWPTSTVYGVLLHFEPIYEFKSQIYIKFNGETYIRGWSTSNGWSAWKQVTLT